MVAHVEGLDSAAHEDQPTGDRVLYRMDWSAFLGPLGDTIDTAPGSSVWSVAPAWLTLGPDQVEAGNLAATVWIEGGTTGERYTVSNRITTVAGRVVERSFVLGVGER